MTKRAQARLSDQVFFARIKEVAFNNPFSDTTRELERALAGSPPASSSRTSVRRRMAEELRQRVAALEAKGRASLKHYRGEQLEIMEFVFLFDLFCQCIPEFDQLIERQVGSKERSLKCRFAPEVLARLEQMGFSQAEALKRFSILYQLRRAYYFVKEGLIGRSPCMRELRRDLWNNIFTGDIRWYVRHLWDRMEDYTTLLLGPTGTGKGAAAAAIGRSGYIPFDPKTGCFEESFTQAFLTINLSQFPEGLIESELFGHRKGAFTGAVEHHEGVFSRCSPNGSIFLDEIGDVSVPIQIKLLQVLQERRFSPVGGHDDLRFQGRVIAATNRSLPRLREEGKFRDDFYYRLCSDAIEVPPLARRIAQDPRELNDMVAHLLTRMTGREDRELESLMLTSLQKDLPHAYAWPGNVRELEQALRRILLSGAYRGDPNAAKVEAGNPMLIHGDDGAPPRPPTAQELLAQYCAALYREHESYVKVANITGLDRRTVKKYVETHVQ